MMKVDNLVFKHVDLNKNPRLYYFFSIRNKQTETFLFFKIELCSFPYLIEYFALDPTSMMMISVSLNKNIYR
jgi:hypothetical protein